MKVLIVCSNRKYATEGVAPFIYDQVLSIRKMGIDVDYFLIKDKGIIGYFKNINKLRKKIMQYKPDIIHAHYGLAGLFANFQTKIPVVTTYHGSDINVKKNLRLSKICIRKSKWNIFVSEKLVTLSNSKKKYSVIPCGVDFELFKVLDKNECRNKLGLIFNEKKKYVLFSKMFYDPVKNYPLAKESIEILENAELIEFIGYTREEACLLMNACDAVILTSFMEGSPQFIKEAMACNCPIVSVDVGDVKNVIKDANCCFITNYDKNDISACLKNIFINCNRTNGREMVKDFNNNLIAEKIINIYNTVLGNRK